MEEKENTMDFEAEMKRLEETARKMSLGDLPLEESLRLYAEAVELAGRLKEYIDSAKLKLEAPESRY